MQAKFAVGIVCLLGFSGPVAAQESFSCMMTSDCARDVSSDDDVENDVETCRSDSGTAFAVEISADGETAAVTLPDFGLPMQLSLVEPGRRHFDQDINDGKGFLAILLGDDGAFSAVRSEIVFLTVTERRISGACQEMAE